MDEYSENRGTARGWHTNLSPTHEDANVVVDVSGDQLRRRPRAVPSHRHPKPQADTVFTDVVPVIPSPYGDDEGTRELLLEEIVGSA